VSGADPRIASLEKLLAQGRDSPLLRFSLGNAHLAGEPERAVEHLKAALALDPSYVAAWKVLGQALVACGRTEEAKAVYGEGIVTAEVNGQVQAAKEMRVFLKRLLR
jgi:predicted Zn-dependent protease